MYPAVCTALETPLGSLFWGCNHLCLTAIARFGGGRAMNGNTTDAADSEARDFLYREYARLAECCNGYVKGALTDIKLLGGIGAVLAWDPVSRMLDLDAHLDQPVTPVGFIALLLVVMFVLFYNLLKQSLLFY